MSLYIKRTGGHIGRAGSQRPARPHFEKYATGESQQTPLEIAEAHELSDITAELLIKLNIPDNLHDAARTEAHRAYFEGRDIESALRYWHESQ